jgi:ankyrin repeat protein
MTTTTYDHANWYEAERLHRAAQDGDIQEIERLILAGYDVNLFDDMAYTPLHHAVMGGSIEAVKALLRHGAPVNANDYESIGETPLALAVQSEHLELVCLLLDSGADPDINGWMGITARVRAFSRADQMGKETRELLAAYPRKS